MILGISNGSDLVLMSTVSRGTEIDLKAAIAIIGSTHLSPSKDVSLLIALSLN